MAQNDIEVEAARSKYQRSFDSNIFGPGSGPCPRVPLAGQRRDLSSSEIFGTHSEAKHLSKAPGTFEPSKYHKTARDKLYESLQSSIFENSSQSLARNPYVEPTDFFAGEIRKLRETGDFGAKDRHSIEMQSCVFGEQPYKQPPLSNTNRDCLLPSDADWSYSPNKSGLGQDEHASVEECRMRNFSSDHSFPDHSTPSIPPRGPELLDETPEMAARRRDDNQYSDLFGRGYQRQRGQHTASNIEDDFRSTVQGDTSEFATNKGNLVPLKTIPKAHHEVSPSLKARLRVLGDESVCEAIKKSHMQSSVVDEAFYESASRAQTSNVFVASLKGITNLIDERLITEACRNRGCHVVKASVDRDPISDNRSGSGRITFRCGKDQLQDYYYRLNEALQPLRIEIVAPSPKEPQLEAST
eukprot:GHVL01003744.1.p1 GENE.GHVL01003744.1~~GHVL01003744.1.p1  ORF type:complete len:413 (-),score=57.49 GHVL01003744.1:1335-2573(-)